MRSSQAYIIGWNASADVSHYRSITGVNTAFCRYNHTVQNGHEGAKAVAVADKIHNIESLLIAHSAQGPRIWQKFNRGKEQKLWFENEVLSMLKATWSHPLIEEYENLLEQEANLE